MLIVVLCMRSYILSYWLDVDRMSLIAKLLCLCRTAGNISHLLKQDYIETRREAPVALFSPAASFLWLLYVPAAYLALQHMQISICDGNHRRYHLQK